MDKIFNFTSIIAGAVGGFIASLFGAWDTILWALVVVMALDYITGIIKAFITKKVSSRTGFSGLLKKVVILVIVALSNVIQVVTGGNVPLREIVIMFYIANEGISILENVAEVSPNMPKALKDVLTQLRGEDK